MGICNVATASCSNTCGGGGTIQIDGQSIFDAIFDSSCFTMTDDCKYCPIQKLTSITNSATQPGCLDYLDEAGVVSTWCPPVQGMDTNTTYAFSYANMGGVFNLIVTDSDGNTVFNQPVPCNCPAVNETLTSLAINVVGNAATITYTDENGHGIPQDLCPAIKACETVTSITVVPDPANPGVNIVTYNNEAGTPVSFPACSSCGTGADGNTTYTITGSNLVGSDGSSEPIPCTCGSETVTDTLTTGNLVATYTNIDATTVSVYESVTTMTFDADTGLWTYTSEDRTDSEFCGRNWTRYPFCYEITPASTEQGCEEGEGTVLFREDFETPSSTDATATAPDGLGPFTTDFDLSVNAAPNWAQLYAEGIYRVMPAGAIPVGNAGGGDIHSNWIDFAPYSTGYAAFNLQPGTGATGQAVLEIELTMTAGKCYTFRMHAIDTHTEEFNAANGVDLADLGLVVNGVIVGTTGPITPSTTGTDSNNQYDITFMPTTTGTQTMTIVSNNSATNGNDIFMNFIKVLERDVVTIETPAVCGTGRVKEQLDCNGEIIEDTTVYLDASGAVIESPVPCNMCN